MPLVPSSSSLPVEVDNAALVGSGGAWTSAQITNANVASNAAVAPSKFAGFPSDATQVLLGSGSWGTVPGTGGGAGGDLGGTFPNPSLDRSKKYYAPLPGQLVLPDGSLFTIQTPGTGATFSPTNTWGWRMVMPASGTLHDIASYVISAGTTLEVGIIDTAATTRTRLYTSGAIACPASGAWRIFADPNLVVTQGQTVDFYLGTSVGTPTLPFMQLPSTAAAAGQLPAGFFPATGSGSPRMIWTIAAASTTGASIAESSLVSGATAPYFIARIT